MTSHLLSDIPAVYLGLIGSAIAGLGTGLGALPILLLRRITDNTQGIMLGFVLMMFLDVTLG